MAGKNFDFFVDYTRTAPGETLSINVHKFGAIVLVYCGGETALFLKSYANLTKILGSPLVDCNDSARYEVWLSGEGNASIVNVTNNDDNTFGFSIKCM